MSEMRALGPLAGSVLGLLQDYEVALECHNKTVEAYTKALQEMSQTEEKLSYVQQALDTRIKELKESAPLTTVWSRRRAFKELSI